MGDFSAEWLALREPADHQARSADLTRAVLGTLPSQGLVTILDLACGTGSNLRYLAATLNRARDNGTKGRRTHWLLVDRDPELLARVDRRPDVETRRLDVSRLDGALFRGVSLVTASALLDLVSEAWIRQLVERCRESQATALFALTYDGRISCEPAEPDDARVRELVNRHQKTDKGFGPALGPAAGEVAAECFRLAGFVVRQERSDWVLSPSAAQLQRELIEGWASAAGSTAPDVLPLVFRWKANRLAHVAAGRSTIVVGHTDLAALAGATERR